MDATADLHQSLGICFLIQSDPRSFISANVNATLPFLEGGEDSLCGLTAFDFLRKPISLTIFISYGGLVSTYMVSFAGIFGKFFLEVGQLNFFKRFCSTLQPTLLKMNQ